MNMTEEQINRYLDIEEQKVEAIKDVGYELNTLADSIRGAYDGRKSAFWGMSQALFSMVDAERNGDGLRIIKQDDE